MVGASSVARENSREAPPDGSPSRDPSSAGCLRFGLLPSGPEPVRAVKMEEPPLQTAPPSHTGQEGREFNVPPGTSPLPL